MVFTEPQHQKTSSTGSVQLIKQHVKGEEPTFMKYMKGVNLNDDEAYLKQHFDEEDNT